MPEHKKTKESEKYHEGLMKGLEVLDCLQGCPEMTLTQIAEETGLYKSRVMRICGTLEYMGYVVFDEKSRVYRLGPRIASLARVYESTNPLLAVIKPTLETLFDALRQSIAFHRVHGDRLICVYRLSRGVSPHDNTPVWQDNALYYGARGRVMLAFGPTVLRERFFDGDAEYKALTPYTIVDRDVLIQEVENVRRQGYAITSDERVIGLLGIAAPVFQYGGELVGVISVSGEKEAFDEHVRARAVETLIEETRKLSLKLGAAPTTGKSEKF